MKRILLTLMGGFVLLGILSNNSIGKDTLFLTGQLRKLEKSFTVIYVTSENCKGKRKFKIDKEIYKIIKKNKDRFSIKIYFMIDSDVCHKKKLDKITEVEE